MSHQAPRFVRIARIRLRRAIRRLDRQTPEWLRWVTPWCSSLILHLVILVPLALFVEVVQVAPRWTGATLNASLTADQLKDDVFSLRDADRAGDPFASLKTDEPPSLALSTENAANRFNVPDLPPEVRLAPNLQLKPAAPALERKPETNRKKGGGRVGSGTGQAVPDAATLAAMAAPIAGRRPEMRAKLVLREGGTKESEAAVERGLDWLARHQNQDGSWNLDTSGMCVGDGCPAGPSMFSDTAATGLGLLPFLAAGHDHIAKGRYQMNVLRGLRWLVKAQEKDGKLFTGGGILSGMYSHAIATMALCEAYALTHDKSLRDPAQRGIRFIVRAQSTEDGGWRYVPGMLGDTSVLGWQVFALRSASLGGLSLSKKTIGGARKFLDLAIADPQKMTYAYRPGMGVRATMTAEGLVCRQILGWPRDHPAMRGGTALVAADLEQSTERNIYYWYYATQLLHNMHDKNWERWNERVRDGLVMMQATGAGCARGSWDPLEPQPDEWGQKAGRLYTTSLSLLTLEVYYRYLPLYRDRGGQFAGNAEAAPAEPNAPKANPDAPKTDPKADADPVKAGADQRSARPS